ncbi:FAD-dependent oxidoreductase [Streptomyces sp. NPDC047009]|uniref:NAD(P)/FAD-dependent oxidoreductase n=1 Tax=Streptomyces sp. NPDC047009 TaxID=3154496 RepID=UPI0033D7F7B3
MTERPVVVIGSSLAGLSAVETLREAGYEGLLTLVGEEPHQPYDRPPLSKQLLLGTWEAAETALRPDGHLSRLGVEMHLGRRAVALDPAARTVTLDDGTPLAYAGAVIATGARPRRIPGVPDRDGVHVLRSLDDALALRTALVARPRVVVAGAGFIGLEVAAAARAVGCEVTVLEPLRAPLTRVLGPVAGGRFAALHAERGVRVECGVGVSGVRGAGRVEEVRLTDGRLVAADVLVVGAGVAPNTEWLDSSGLPVGDGVRCDVYCASGAAGVYAAGDVARWPNPLFGEEMRVEHWTNAVEQGRGAARNLIAELRGRPGERRPFAPVPSFWSDQWGEKIQFAGRAAAEGRTAVVLDEPDRRRFALAYARGGTLRGALVVNAPRVMAVLRRLLAAGASLDDAVAAVRT